MKDEKRLRGAHFLWVVAGLASLYLVARFLGLESFLGPARLRALVGDAGPWGPLLFTGLFAAGVLAQVPGLVFISAAPLLFPAQEAWLLSMLAGNLAVNLNFAAVRRIGGRVQLSLEKPWAQRLLERLEENPLRAVILLRLIFVMFPPITGALALTPLRTRDHAFGSAVGLLAPITGVVWIEALLLG